MLKENELYCKTESLFRNTNFFKKKLNEQNTDPFKSTQFIE
jgi:hypothetical protein